jgi:hypothetical protein
LQKNSLPENLSTTSPNGLAFKQNTAISDMPMSKTHHLIAPTADPYRAELLGLVLV